MNKYALHVVFFHFPSWNHLKFSQYSTIENVHLLDKSLLKKTHGAAKGTLYPEKDNANDVISKKVSSFFDGLMVDFNLKNLILLACNENELRDSTSEARSSIADKIKFFESKSEGLSSNKYNADIVVQASKTKTDAKASTESSPSSTEKTNQLYSDESIQLIKNMTPKELVRTN